MKAIDLSHLINQDITVYPGSARPVLENIHSINKDGFAELNINMLTHTDAPCHIIQDAKSLDDFPVEKFMGRGIIIDCKQFAGKEIPLSYMEQFESRIKQSEFILFNSGWSLKWKTEGYFRHFPILSSEATAWLSGFNLKGIGLDCISIDSITSQELPNHHIVLSKEILIIENLTGLDSITADTFTFQCLPLKIEHADGSPIRAIAWMK